MFKIFGTYQNTTEEIDQFDSKEKAIAMLAEYQLAYGSGWKLWVSK